MTPKSDGTVDDSLLYVAKKMVQWGFGDAELEHAVSENRFGIQEIDNLHNAVVKYQEFWREDLTELTLKIHGRVAMADGDVGPATSKMVLDRRCDVPDIMYASDGSIIEEANIPVACRSNYGIYVDFSGYRESQMGMSLDMEKKAWAEAFAKWSEIVDLNYVLVDSRNDAYCTVDYQALAGTTLAWSNLATGQCAKGQQQRYDVRRWDWMLALKTKMHELGHLAGSHHLNGKNIMHPSIRDDIDTFSDYEINHFRKNLGYNPGKPRDPDPIDPTDPTDPNWTGYKVEVRTADGKVFYADNVKYLNFLLQR